MPYAPDVTPDVAPSGAALPEARIPVSPEAFGGQVGQSLQHMGVQMESVGDRLFNRAVEIQGLANETAAKNADAEAAMQYESLYTDLASKEGLNARNAMPQYKEDLNNVRLKIREKLPNDAARRMYDSSSLQSMIRVMFAGARHANTQFRSAQVSASEARIDMAKQSMYEHPEDEDWASTSQKTIENEIQATGERLGWDQDTINDRKKKEVSDAVARRTGGLARKDVAGATELYNRDLPKLTHDDDLRVQRELRTQTNQVVPRLAADAVLNDVRASRTLDDIPSKSPSDYEEEALKLPMVQAAMQNNPALESSVRAAVSAQYHKIVSDKNEFEHSNWRTVAKALETPGPDGFSRPTNLKELVTVGGPAAQAAYGNLDGDNLKKVHQIFIQNAKGENTPPTPKNIESYTHWMGVAMGNGSVDDQAEFMSKNFALDNSFTNSQRTALGLAQQKFKKAQGNFDPRVQRAMDWLKVSQGGALHSLYLDRYTQDHATDYYQFQGILHDALDTWEADYGKAATEKDVTERIGPMLLTSHMVKRLGGWLPDKEVPAFRDVPQAFTDEVKQEALAAKRPVPTADAIMRAYNARQLQKLYPASSSAKSQDKPQFNQPKPPMSQ